ncbi:MAG: redoxin domain-containing protein [Terriglobales bacterium]
MRKMLIICASLLFASTCFAESQKAPDFSSDAVWLDSGSKVPHSIKGYRGRVLLVDFWEYTCINCIRDISILKRWYAKYRPFGFEIVGVHDGEFAMGYSVDNVRRAAKRLQLPWPVVADIHGSIWNAYKSRVWPNRFLVDQSGNIVLHVEGEAGNQEMESKIRELLEPGHPEISKIPEEPSENALAPQCGSTTDETYVGDWLGRGALENLQHYRDGSVVDFKPSQEPHDGGVMLAGKWQTDRDGVTSADKKGGNASLRYHARSVYAVLSVENPKKPVRLYVLQDEKPLTTDDAGADVKFDPLGSYIEVSEPRMYYVIRNPSSGSHLLVLNAQGGGLALHSFTYGNDCQQDFAPL